MLRLIFFTVLLFVLSFNVKGQNIRLITANELETRLSNGKDTTFIVNFWATWCVPCQKELPYLEKLQTEFAGQKLKVILLSVDKKSKVSSAVVSFVKRHKIKNEVLAANEQNPLDYIPKIDKSWSGSIPATLIVNKSKNERKFFEKAFTYSELLKEYRLAELNKLN